jgi:hypothetical protein
LTRVAGSSWLGLTYLTVFGSMVGFTAYAWLLSTAPLSLVSTYTYVNPLVTILLESWLAHEFLNACILLAALIIVSSVVVINISRYAKKTGAFHNGLEINRPYAPCSLEYNSPRPDWFALLVRTRNESARPDFHLDFPGLFRKRIIKAS